MDEARDRQLIRLLADGELHSGEAIAGQLGISRSAVWKALRKSAEHVGLSLESVRGAGYRLRAPLELLDEGRIRAALSASGQHRLARLEIHDQIDSTNSHLMREAAAGAPSGSACLAERQTAGRGRRGRTWVSPYGVNLYLSLLWRFVLPPAALGGVSLAAGVLIAEILAAAGVSDLALKWPNDLLWRRRKLAGLLVEVAGESQGPSHLVVGVGLNLGMDVGQGSAIDQPWCTLRDALGDRPCGRNVLAAAVLDGLMETLEVYGRAGLAPFLDRWRAFDSFVGEPVRLLFADRVIEGIHAGIADDGSLQLETAEGRRRFQAGEVSIKPRQVEYGRFLDSSGSLATDGPRR